MKRLIALALLLSLLALCAGAGAAGKLRVTQENFHVVESYGVIGYAYARIDNVGDKPIKVNAGILEVFDKDGGALTSTDYMNEYAEYLEPQQYTYVYLRAEVKDAAASDVDDYLLTITGKSSTDYATQRLPCETAFEKDVEDGYWTYDYMYATVTNDTDRPIYDIEVVLVLLDDEGNILCMEEENLYDSKALTPGSSMIIRKSVNSSFKEYFEKNGITPARVDAIAFVNIEKK